MAKKKLKIDQLAKLRQFTPGMDVEKFLSGEFRQYSRALEQAYVEDTENRVSSGICTSFSTASSSWTDITNLNIRITTTGRRLWVGLVWSGVSDTYSSIKVQSDVDGLASGRYQILRDSTVIAQHSLADVATGPTTSIALEVPSSSLYAVEHDLPAGSYVYKVRVASVFGSTGVQNSKLIAYEF